MSVDQLGNRMKEYESSYRIYLPKRMPVIIRIDGKAFHTFTSGMNKPFDEKLANAFQETCKYLAQNIQGCKLVYQQSDEISILITNYDNLNTESWFKNNLQKMASVSASLATAKFNEEIKKHYPEKGFALFDSRVYILPQDEVNNYFLWRQKDASKNSISMVAYANFPHKQLQNLSSSQKQDKLMLEKGINWNDLPIWQKRGICVTKKEYQIEAVTPIYEIGEKVAAEIVVGNAMRKKWEVDFNIPIFSQDKNYINKYVYLEKEED